MTPTNEDYLSAVETSLVWWLFESHPAVNALVKPNNVINTNERFDRKPVKFDADMPMIRLVPVGGDPRTTRTSSGDSFEQLYSIQLSTGTKRSRSLGAVKSALIRAASHLRGGIPELPFVTRVLLVTSSDTEVVNESGTSDGWDWVCGVSVLLNWSKAELES